MERFLRSTSQRICAILSSAPTLALLIALVAVAAVSAQPSDVATLYAKLKSIENQAAFPLPTPSTTVSVGTYDAAKNAFSGLMTSTEDKTPGKPPVKVVPVQRVNAVNVGLVFSAVNHKSPVTITVNGSTFSIPVGQKSVTADIGTASQADWSIQSGQARVHDQLKLTRPTVIGAGAFTVPALPIALVYEPSQGSLKKNSAKYVKTRSEGTTVRLSFSSDSSTTVPADAEFTDVGTAKSAVELAAKGLKLTKDPVALGIAAGLDLIATALGTLGSASANTTTGTSVTKDHTLAIKNSVTTGFTTSAREGPGVGDVAIYLKNARLVWLAQGGKVSLAFLGAEGQVSATVKDLKSELPKLPSPTSLSSRFGLDRATIEGLLALDPFVAGGPKAALDSARYRYVETFEMHGSQVFDYEFLVSVEQSDLNAKSSFTTQSLDTKKGFLSYFGIGVGVQDTKSIKTTTKYSTSTESKVGEDIRVSGHFELQGGEDYAVTAMYDRAFGTVAFVPVAVGPELVSGLLKNASGLAMARQRVSLVVGGRKITTITDAKGQYSFRSVGIARGPATLIAGSVRQNVTLASAALRGVELRQVK